MSVPAYLLAAAGLGVGGFDPAPLLIAAVFMAARPATEPHQARAVRRSVLVFGLVLIGGTVLWGVLLSELVGQRLAEVDWARILRWGAWAAGIELALAAAGLVWAGWKWRHRLDPPAPEKNRSSWGLVLVALGFVAIVTSDVPFVVTIGLSGPQPLWAVVLGQVLWALVSQSPLFVLCLAVLANRHRTVAAVVGGWWARIRPVVNTVLPVAVAVLALLMVLDAGRFFLLHRFLIG